MSTDRRGSDHAVPKKTTRDTVVVSIGNHARRGREESLEALFSAHRVALKSFLSVKTGIVDELDDIVQEVFLRLMHQPDLESKIDGQAGSAKAYLFTIANNLVVDMQRRSVLQRNYARSVRNEGENRSIEITPERSVQSSEELSLVKREILKLRPKCQQAFLLSRVESMSYKQIASHMNISTKQVEKYISQALRKLRAAVRRTER